MTAGAQQAVSLQLVKPLGAVVDGFGAVAISSGIAAGELGGVDHLEAMLLTVWESCHRLLVGSGYLREQIALKTAQEVGSEGAGVAGVKWMLCYGDSGLESVSDIQPGLLFVHCFKG